MCTVTFIPRQDGVLFASNRDEKHFRSHAVKPQLYKHDGRHLFYPKDQDAGGTWIAYQEPGNVVVFLNGGKVSHKPNPPYRRSRGMILIDLLGNASPVDAFKGIELSRIEPFTAIIYDQECLFECRWDGHKKSIKEVGTREPRIWSSATLYEPSVIEKRESWFKQWLKKHANPDLAELLHFHQFTGDGDKHNDLLMNRNGHVYTVSITGISLKRKNGLMHYIDLKDQQESITHLPFVKALSAN